MNIALVAIAKNEDHYIDEWLQYHFNLGFTKAFVYQNNWRYAGDKTQYGDKVEWIEFDGEVQQLPAYNDFLFNRSEGFDFAAFIDVDEFIVLNKDPDISTFLEDYTDEFAVGLNWKVFGDSNLDFCGQWSVLERFTWCQKGFNKHIKTILNLNRNQKAFHFANPHFVVFCPAVDVDKTKHFIGPFNDECNTSRAWINHYHVKTKQEWQQKMARGRADTNRLNYKLEDFDKMNFNDVQDLTIYDRLSKTLSK